MKNYFFIAILSASTLLCSCRKTPVASFDYDNISINSALQNSKSNILPGDQVKFFLRTIDGESYSWDFGDGNTSKEMSPVHVYKRPGTYSVKLTAVNGSKTGYMTRTITVANNYFFTYQPFYGGTTYSSGNITVDTATTQGIKYLWITTYPNSSDEFGVAIDYSLLANSSASSWPSAEFDFFKYPNSTYSTTQYPGHFSLNIQERDAYHIKGGIYNATLYTTTGSSVHYDVVLFNAPIP